MESKDIIAIIVALVGGGGLLGGIYTLLKLRPEAGQITVTTAQGVLIMQSQVITDLRAVNDKLQSRVDALEAKNDALEAENLALKQRLGALEGRIAALEAQYGVKPGEGTPL